MKTRTILVCLLAFLAAAPSAGAQTAPVQGAAATAPALTNDGEVRKIDREQGRLTLRHGPLKKFDMPAMTMVFKVPDPKMLDALSEGDMVRFDAEKVEGGYAVTALEKVK